MSTPPSEPIGLIAGWGSFPIHFATKARELGLRVACVGLKHEADPVLATLSDRFRWTGVAQMGRMIQFLKQSGVSRVVMAGKVHKHKIMYAPWRLFSLCPDWRTVRFWFGRRRANQDNKDDSLLLAMIDEFAKDGLTFESALAICPELLVKPGVLTRRRPTTAEQRDIEFGWQLAREMGRLDVGQSVAVKERAVLAVEAIEGTDRNILRAGDLCGAGGFTVVKVAKPHQDMRFDVPTVGPTTIASMKQARARVLAIEANKTILLEPQATIHAADAAGITVVALEEPHVARG
jgi:DUF1009 family protein